MNKLNKWVNLMLVDEDPNYYYCIAYASLINVVLMFHYVSLLCWIFGRATAVWNPWELVLADGAAIRTVTSTILLISH